MPSRLTGFVCPTVSMVTTGHATGVEKTLLMNTGPLRAKTWPGTKQGSLEYIKNTYSLYIGLYHLSWSCTALCF